MEKYTETERNPPANWFDSDIEFDPPSGVVGMTLSLIELLTTLMTKGSVWGMIQGGLIPLITTVSSYMILSKEQEEEHLDD